MRAHSSNICIALSRSSLSRRKNVVSSANCCIFILVYRSFRLILIPWISLLRILIANSSTASTNNTDNNGHPWRIPRSNLKGSNSHSTHNFPSVLSMSVPTV